eukprot:scaffold8001_cov125-Isochrysis_galbana.AAC.6
MFQNWRLFPGFTVDNSPTPEDAGSTPDPGGILRPPKGRRFIEAHRHATTEEKQGGAAAAGGGHLTVVRRAARIRRLAGRWRIIRRRIWRRVAASSRVGSRLSHGRRVMRWGSVPSWIGRAVVGTIRRRSCVVTCGTISLRAPIAGSR